jgi:hypothetical protein
MLYITLCVNPGALMVFGGDPYPAMNNMEILNGTIWVTMKLKYPRSYHAMVLLPCP